jgi:transcriptional regulator with XRE-family HTH domain
LKTFKELVGERIKARRIALKMTQQELADSLETDQSRIARWEAGKNLPDKAFRPSLSKALSASIDEIFAVTESTPVGTPTQASMAQTIALLQAENDDLRASLAAFRAFGDILLVLKRASRFQQAFAMFVLTLAPQYLDAAMKEAKNSIQAQKEFQELRSKMTGTGPPKS